MRKPDPQPPAPSDGSTLLRFADCELHLPTRELWRLGELQPLRRRVFDLIVFLIQRRPATATHAEIAKAVWGQAEVRSSLIAQAVMQARRAVGDTLDQPRHIISVHGVGYRFGATVTTAAAQAWDAAHPKPADDLRAAVEEAEAADARGDAAAALYLCEQIIPRAQQANARADCARAMAMAARITLYRGTMQTAARYAYQSLRLAEAEGQDLVLAKARLAVAQVQMAVGEHQGALQHLAAAFTSLQPAGPTADLQLCEHVHARVYRELRQFDAARQWCARCQHTTRQLQPALRAVKIRNVELNICLFEAEQADEDLQPERAQALYAQALQLNEGLRADIDQVGNRMDELCWYGNQGQALMGLGRLDEAWHATAKAETLLQAQAETASPWYFSHLQELHLQWAVLLGKSQRHTEALEHVALGLAAAERSGEPADIARLAAVASRVCEGAGRYRDALSWLQRHQTAQRQVQKDQAAKLALVGRIRLETDVLRHELQTTQHHLVATQDQNRKLLARLEAFERYGAPDPSGLVSRAGFLAALKLQHEEALLRDLPCCAAVLRLDAAAALASGSSPLTHDALRYIAGAIRSVLASPQLAVCRWSDQCLVFALDDMGERRAATVCADLQQRLGAELANAAQAPCSAQPRALSINLAVHAGFAEAQAALDQAAA